MLIKEKARHIFIELKGHAPFTFLGAILGVAFLLLFKNASRTDSYTLFSVFHPTHVVLSALVTASMFTLHAKKKKFILILLVGYFGSIGIATVSDIIIPHVGANLIGLNVPTHTETHHRQSPQAENEHVTDEPNRHPYKIHLGFIEDWYIVNPAAVLGVLIAFCLPRTKFPHTAHVFISTWASSSYLLMNIQSEMTIAVAIGLFVTLFIATWLPCCISDIVFPLLFVKSDVELTEPCPRHDIHSHPHLHRTPQDSQKTLDNN